jgi:hypothetical protein
MKLLHKGDRGEILMLSASNFFARIGLFRQSELNPEGFRRFGRVFGTSICAEMLGSFNWFAAIFLTSRPI